MHFIVTCQRDAGFYHFVTDIMLGRKQLCTLHFMLGRKIAC